MVNLGFISINTGLCSVKTMSIPMYPCSPLMDSVSFLAVANAFSLSGLSKGTVPPL